MTGPAPSGTRLALRLGTGSVFEVSLVRDERGRELICKRVASQARLVSGDSALDRERELLAAAKSSHLPELVAWGSDERGGFVLEGRACGAPVRELIRDVEPRFAAASWLDLARASSQALAHLHELRDDLGSLEFVHGDVSPDNLFFEAPLRVTFIDLSSARWRNAPGAVFRRDRGTLPYVAPELARGECTAETASDTYALAATLLAVAVGPAITHASTDASRLLEVGTRGLRSERIEERADLPKRARRAILEALRFDRASRLASARELAGELENQ